jgi:hypothetical protein
LFDETPSLDFILYVKIGLALSGKTFFLPFIKTIPSLISIVSPGIPSALFT